MNNDFTCKKAENCFSDAQTYQYTFAPLVRDLLPKLESAGDFCCKTNFRRPFFSLTLKDGTRVKGTLTDHCVKASFTEGNWQAAKTSFETWLAQDLLK